MEVTNNKIHRLAYSSLLGIAYVFLSQMPGFIFGNHKHLTKVLDFWFAVKIFNIQAGLDFHQDFCLF